MAISNYTELQTAVAKWMARDDLNDMIPDFIHLFEAYINRVLLTRPMTTSAPLPVVAGVGTLPPDYLAMRSLYWSGTTREPLVYVTPDYFVAAYRVDSAAIPSVYTIQGDTLKCNSTDASGLVITYQRKVPPLSSDLGTNWLLTDHPDFYLFGSLTEGNAYAQDVQAASAWKARRDELQGELFLQAFRAPGPLEIKVAGATP